MAISRGIDYYYAWTIVDRSLLIAGIPIDSNAEEVKQDRGWIRAKLKRPPTG